MKTKITVLLFLVFFSVSASFADKTLDKNPKNKVKEEVIKKLTIAHRKRDHRNILKYAEEALKLFRAEKNRKGEADCLAVISGACLKLGHYKKALEQGKKALEIYEKMKFTLGIAASSDTIGGAYLELGDYEKAVASYTRALKIKEKMGNDNYTAVSLSNIGTVYTSWGKYDQALECHLKAMKLFEKTGYKIGIAGSFTNIANLYHDLKNVSKALEYYRKAMEINEKIGDKEALVYSLNGLGNLYSYSGNYKKAMEFHVKALKISEEIGDRKGASDALSQIGLIYFLIGDHDRSLEYRQRALKISEEAGDKWGIINSYIHNGNSYLKHKDYEKALACFKISLKMADETNAKVLKNESCKAVSSVYAAMGDYKNAFQYHQLFHQSDKKLVDEKSRKQINQLQIQYETEKKEQEITLLKKDKKIRDLSLSKTTFTRNAFIIGFLLVSIILGLLFKKYLYLFAFWKKEKYIGRFKLMDKVGSGATGTVYKAHSIVDKSQIAAVKILKEELFSDENSKKRFKREAEIIDKLEHPHIIRIMERGEYKRRLFTAMEFLEGKTLERKLSEKKQLTLNECLDIMVQISQVVVFIHAKNILHRDLKPANIMLIEQNGDPDFVKLLDFGLAKMEFQSRLTQSDHFVGTIEYVSPELILNADSSPASDIFAMGVIFYRMLCGSTPFQGDTVIDIMRRIINKKPAEVSASRPGIPEELNRLVMTMIDKKPGHRPSALSIRQTFQHLAP